MKTIKFGTMKLSLQPEGLDSETTRFKDGRRSLKMSYSQSGGIFHGKTIKGSKCLTAYVPDKSWVPFFSKMGLRVDPKRMVSGSGYLLCVYEK